MNQINIEEISGLCLANGLSGSRQREGNKQGATAYAIYLAVIDD